MANTRTAARQYASQRAGSRKPSELAESDWLGGEGGIICRVKTAFVPNAWDAVQLIKLIPAMIIADAHYRGHAISKCELLGLKRIVILPLVEKVFQFSLISDSDTRLNREISLIWSIRLAHGISTNETQDQRPLAGARVAAI